MTRGIPPRIRSLAPRRLADSSSTAWTMRNPRARSSVKAVRTSPAAVDARRKEGTTSGAQTAAARPARAWVRNAPITRPRPRHKPVDRSGANFQERSQATQRPERSTWPAEASCRTSATRCSQVTREFAGIAPGVQLPVASGGQSSTWAIQPIMVCSCFAWFCCIRTGRTACALLSRSPKDLVLPKDSPYGDPCTRILFPSVRAGSFSAIGVVFGA